MKTVERVERIIDCPFTVNEKINEVSLALWRGIQSQLIEQCDTLAEDIVFGRISFPNVVEFACKVD